MARTKPEGSGRKLRSTTPTINKTIRFTSEEWQDVENKANTEGITPSEYIRRKALE